MLRNGDELSEKDRAGLERLRTVNQDLADAYELKEELRRIYRFAESPYDAMLQFRSWMAKANATEVPELVAMAGMIRRHQKGMLGFWKLNRKSSASMEGFNGKVRWLMKRLMASVTSSSCVSRSSTCRQRIRKDICECAILRT